MKHIELQIPSAIKYKDVLNVFKKFNIKFMNNYYVIEDKLFTKLKKEIDDLQSDLSIIRNPDYVIIKEKMGRITSQSKYVTLTMFNKFVNVVNNFVIEQKEFNKEVRMFMKKQDVFNKKVEKYMEKQNIFNEKVENFMEKQNIFNERVENYMDKQDVFNKEVRNYMVEHP